jgi:hypothetical protein
VPLEPRRRRAMLDANMGDFKILCPRMSADVRGCPRMSSNVLECPPMSADVRECPRMSANVRECPRMSVDVRECPWMSANVRGCPRMSSNVRECPRMSANVRGLTTWISLESLSNLYRISPESLQHEKPAQIINIFQAALFSGGQLHLIRKEQFVT